MQQVYNSSGSKINMDGETDGSTLTIKGNGSLETRGGAWGCGIGGRYSTWTVSNIIINSGNITALGGGGPSCGIGGGLRQPVGNITINDGTIYAKGGYSPGIGSYGSTEQITINGGNITALGGEYGGGIGLARKIQINGGRITATSWGANHSAIEGSESVAITGGTIMAYSTRGPGILCNEGGKIQITGGNILAKGNNSATSFAPTDGTNSLYVTPIKLQNVEGNIKVDSITTSDNISYGIKDLSTFEDYVTTTDTDETGMVYLYLPNRSRTITLMVNGKTYSGTVETIEEGQIIMLE